MKFCFCLLSILMTSHIFALKNVEQVDCISRDSALTLQMIKSRCVDARYRVWQKNGCYQATVTVEGVSDTFEMVRNLSFELEERSGSYAFYTYDDTEWILDGLITEMMATDGRAAARMRFDTRENRRQSFKSTYGYCLIINE